MENSRIESHYDRNLESDRYQSPHGKLEYERTKSIISRYLQGGPLDILDVGGAVGEYSFWLATLGHRVSMIDLSSVQVEFARSRNRESGAKLEAIDTGNALDLSFPDGSFDVVLNMGPMYHLVDSTDRIRALREMRRVLREDGVLVSAYISRFASLMDGYRKNMILDPVYVPIVSNDLETGIHDGPDDDECFTLAYLHKPCEIRPELETAGFRDIEVRSVEGFFWTYPHLGEYVGSSERFAKLLEYAELIENEPSLMGASAHLLSTARNPKR